MAITKKFINPSLPIPPHGEPLRAGFFPRLLACLYYTLATIPTAVAIMLTAWYDRGQYFGKKFITFFLRGDVHYIGTHADKHDSFKGMIVSSHKSWGDFACMTLFGMAGTMARKAVAFGVPFIWLANLTCHVIFFFKRGNKSQEARDKFNRDIHAFLKKNPRLLVYAEGTRAHTRGVLRLRTGMLHIAYDAGLKVLVAPMEGCQYLFNERTGAFLRSRVPIVVCCEEVVDPKDCENFEEFEKRITEAFVAGYTSACEKYDSLATGVKFWPWVKLTHKVEPAAPAPARAPAEGEEEVIEEEAADAAAAN